MVVFFRRMLGRALRFSRSRLRNVVSIFFPSSLRGLSASALRRIEHTVAEAEGKKVRCLRYASLQGLCSYDAARRFWSVECLVGGEKKISLFVKVGGSSLRKYRLTEALGELCLPVPVFYGAFRDCGRAVAIWRYSAGRCLPAFQFFTDENLSAAARAVAIYNISGLQCDYILAGSKEEPKWATPVAHVLISILNSHEELLARRDVIERFACFEIELLAVLNEAGVCFNHNDFKASNMLFLEDGSCQITDLDSSSLGAIGASLRCFSYLSFAKRDLVVREYVSQLREFGVTCSPVAVHHVMCAQQLLWAFHTGVRLNCIQRMVHWLDHFSRLYFVDNGELFLKDVGLVSKACM